MWNRYKAWLAKRKYRRNALNELFVEKRQIEHKLYDLRRIGVYDLRCIAALGSQERAVLPGTAKRAVFDEAWTLWHDAARKCQKEIDALTGG